MNESPHAEHAETDRDPAPLEHADAERATGDEGSQVPNQPTEAPDSEDELEDLKGA